MNDLKKYAERMRQKVVKEIAAIRKDVDGLRQALASSEAAIARLQEMCPHMNLKDHPRKIAEESPWSECLDCGARI